MSDYLEYKGYRGSVEFSSNDKRLFGEVLFVDALLMYNAESVAELEQEFRSTIDAYLAFCAKTGREPEKPFSGSFNVRVGKDLHRQAALVAHEERSGLNDLVIRALTAYIDSKHAAPINHVHKHFVEIVSIDGSAQVQTGTTVQYQPIDLEAAHVCH